MYLILFATSALVVLSLGSNSCEEGWNYYEPEEKCLKYIAELKSFENSISHCQSLDAVMSKIQNSDKNDFIEGIRGDRYLSYNIWLPLKAFDGVGYFKYYDGTQMDDSYSPWYQDNQFYYISDYYDYDCAVRDLSLQSNPVWLNNECSNQNVFVCEKDAIASLVTCDDKWHLNPDSDTCFKPIKKIRKNFEDAKDYCVNLGGRLTTKMLSRKNRDFIMKYIKYRAHFWIGVYRSGQDGLFGDLDGTVMESTSPFKRAGTNGDCVSMKRKMWYSKRCERRQFFICQKDPVINN